jgi:tetratricopeptide (TPR) repeat protein
MAILFKEPAITLLVILIAYDSLFRKWDKTMASAIKVYIPYVAVSGLYLVMRYYALRSFAPIESYPGLSTYQFVINVFPLFKEYLTSILWPFDMNLWHTFSPISSLLEAKGLISVIVTLIFIVGAAAAYRRNRVLFFGLLLFIVPLLPVFYIKGISGKPFAERYLYLPSVGYVFLLAVFLAWAREKLPRAVRGIIVVFIVLAGFYAAATVSRNRVWKDDFSLWTDTAKKSHDNAFVHSHLGDVYKTKGLLDRAIEEYQIALRMLPDTPSVHNNLGNAYASKGLVDKAIAEYQTALRLRPKNAEAHNNLGAAYASQGLVDKAMEEYQIALRLKPDYADAHNNLGAAYASQGLLDKAMEEFVTALRLKPHYADAHNNLGNVYASKDLVDKAIGEYQTALRLNPNNANTHHSLARMYLKKGERDMARREVEMALAIRPDLQKARQLLNDITSGQQ